MDAGTYLPSETGIPQGGALSPLLMNVALHGMEAVVAQGAAGEPPLLVRYADNFVLAHANLHELQRAIRRVRHWLATMGLHLHMEKTRITHTLTPFQGQVGFDFLGFHLHQEPGVSIPVGKRGQGQVPGVKTIIAPSQEAIKRHQVAIDHRLQQWQTAPQARVIAELNPLIVGWVAYYNGMVPAASMRRYDDLLEQRLLKWAGKRHPGKEHAWLLARYWRRIGKRPRVFATPDGVQLRAYEQMSILKG